jgi:hypothetical protein
LNQNSSNPVPIQEIVKELGGAFISLEFKLIEMNHKNGEDRQIFETRGAFYS